MTSVGVTKRGRMRSAFAIVLIVAGVWIDPTHAAPIPACTLIVEDLARESTDQWQALGYKIIEIKELKSLHPAKIASLLNDSTFIVFRSPPRQELWFSIVNGHSSGNFRPLSFQAPSEKQTVPKSYACANMRGRLRLFANTRNAVSDTYGMFNGLPVHHSRGSLIIDLEISHFIHNGVSRFNRDRIQTQYANLLDQARIIRVNGGPNFFVTWAQIRSLVYDKDKSNIDYCPGSASMIQALQEKCTNCVGETYLMQAIFDDAGFLPPPNWEIGVQGFAGNPGHLRPILYNLKRERTYDLVTGRMGRFKGSILRGQATYEQLWRGHNALRMSDEMRAMSLRSYPYVWRNTDCLKLFAKGSARPTLQPSDWSTIPFCDVYTSDPQPEGRMDNQSKAQPGTFDEDDLIRAKTDANDSLDLWNRLTSAFGTLSFGGSGSYSGDDSNSIWNSLTGLLKGSDKSDESNVLIPDLQLDSVKQSLTTLAENLIPEEKKALLETIRAGEITPLASKLFSVLRYTNALGRADLMDNPDSDDTRTRLSRIQLPIYIKYVSGQVHSPSNTDIHLMGQVALNPTDPMNPAAYAYFSSCLSGHYHIPHCFITNNKALADEMTAMAGPQRLRKLQSLAKDDLNDLTKAIGDLIIQTHGDPVTILDRLHDDPDAAKLIRTYQSRLDIHSNIAKSVQHGSLNYNGNFIEDDSKYGPRTVAKVFSESLSIHTHIRSIVEDVTGLAIATTEKPLDTLRWLDKNVVGSGDEGADKTISLLETAVDRALELESTFGLKRYNLYSKLDKAWPYGNSVGDTKLTAVLLLRTLTHPNYFITVEPERSEVDPYRPSYPLSIHDPRVQEQEVREGPVMPMTSETYIEVELVCEGADPNETQSDHQQLKVNCQSGIPVRGQGGGHGGTDKIDETGVESGNADEGQIAKQTAGEYERFRDGATREENLGSDQSGETLLKRPLTREESRYPIQPGAVEIRHGSMKARKKAKIRNSIDPRPEVYLDPKTWAFFLKHTKVSNVLAESAVKILLHHVFRRKLSNVWKEFENLGFRIIDPADYDRNLVTLSSDQVGQLRRKMNQGDPYSNQEAVSLLWNLRGTNSNLYMGFDETPFMKAAVDEMMGRLKPGYLLLKREGVFSSKEISFKTLANSFALNTRLLPLGLTLPYLCQDQDHPERPSIVMGSERSSDRCFKEDELIKSQSDLKGVDVRSLIANLRGSDSTSLLYESDRGKSQIVALVLERGSFSRNRRSVYLPLRQGTTSDGFTFADFQLEMKKKGFVTQVREHDNYYRSIYKRPRNPSKQTLPDLYEY